MSLVRPSVYENAVARITQQGDLIAANEAIITLTSVPGLTNIPASNFASGLLLRAGPTAAYTDVLPNASDLILALLSNQYNGNGANTPAGIQAPLAFRLRFINSVAFAATISAGVGVTLGTGAGAIPASNVREYLVTITNGTPQVIYSGTTTNASAVITSLSPAALQAVTVGMLATGTGIPANTTVLGVSTTSITLSANATASGVVAITFNPTYRVDSLGSYAL